MNPLDPQEFTVFYENMLQNMPYHSPNYMEIPNHIVGHWPKNLIDASINIDNKFINNNQHIVEEINHRDKDNEFVKRFRAYQQNYFLNADILSGDGFYKILPDLCLVMGVGAGKKILHRMRHISGSPSTGPTEVFTTTSEISQGTGLNAGRLGASKFAGTATNGGLYSQLALHLDANAGGNTYRLATYDDSSNPNNLYSGSDTGTISVPTSATYVYVAMTTPINLTQTTGWGAFQISAASVATYSTTSASSWKEHTFAYGAFPSTFGSIDFTQGFIIPMKMK